MNLLFETSLELLRVAGNMHFFVRKPYVSPDPVLIGDSEVDHLGAHIYGSVHDDGGRYRMWYQASASAWRSYDSPVVGYAESDDGIAWRKPNLGIVDVNGSKANNLCDLGFHMPSVSILPDAPAERRYFATGCIDSRYQQPYYHRDARPPASGAYFTAYSADGLHWELESPDPIWPGHWWADNIYSVWHPARQCVQVLAKHTGPRLGIMRRNWWESERTNEAWSPRRMALVPDEFDDVAARARGYTSGDYNGIGLLPAGRATVGFIQMHRNRLPYKPQPCGLGCGVYGVLDVTLAWQESANACWIHMPGRPDFISTRDISWAGGMVFCASNVCEFGDEQRLYISGTPASHGVTPSGHQPQPSRIGYASWPKWRLFGYHADDRGELDIDLGMLTDPFELRLNCETNPGGSIRVAMHTLDAHQRTEDGTPIQGRGSKEAVPFTGDAISHAVQWKDGSVIHPVAGKRVIARISMEAAKIYAYEIAVCP